MRFDLQSRRLGEVLGGISYPLLGDIQRDVVKRYGIHWPELNACYRATFVIDGAGIVRFVERYGRGQLAGSREGPGRGPEARLTPEASPAKIAGGPDNLGAHMSIAGGLPNAIHRGTAAGCGVVQIFVKNQLRWAGRRLDEAETVEFRQALAAPGLRAACAHANYLINLATPDPVGAAPGRGRPRRRPRARRAPRPALRRPAPRLPPRRRSRGGLDRARRARWTRSPAGPKDGASGSPSRTRPARATPSARVRKSSARFSPARAGRSASRSASTPATCSPPGTTSGRRAASPRRSASSTGRSGSAGWSPST